MHSVKAAGVGMVAEMEAEIEEVASRRRSDSSLNLNSVRSGLNNRPVAGGSSSSVRNVLLRSRGNSRWAPGSVNNSLSGNRDRIAAR